jgi:hypothetical protein
VQHGDRLRLLVAGPGSDFDGPAVVNAIQRAVESAGAATAAVDWELVAAIPRTTVGKAPLVRADPAVRARHAGRAPVAPL